MKGMKFDVLSKDSIVATVEVNGLYATVTNYDSVLLRLPFGKRTRVTINEVYDYFEYRCVPKTRANIDELLSDMGLKEYDVYSIVRITHGILTDDYLWIRFDDEKDLCWNDVKVWKGE